MREMSNTRIESDDDVVLSVNTILNVQKENNLQLTCNTIENCENFQERTFKNVKSHEADIKHCLNNLQNTINSKQVVPINDDIFPLNKGKPDISVKKKTCLISSSNVNDSEKTVECKIKSSNDNSVKTSETSNNDSDNSTKFYISCRFCRKGFETLEYLNAHDCKKAKSNSSLKMHKCKFCSVTFLKKKYLNKHVKCHKRNNCTICSAQFTKRKALCKHLRTEHNIVEPEKLYHCSFCSKHFSHRQYLDLHLENHANDKYFCLKCDFMCEDKDSYDDHVKEHIKNPKHECHLCEKKFVRRQQYDQHMMAHERYSCSSCNITFSTKNLFLKHQHSVHRTYTEKKHVCPICKKLFLRPKHLKVHQRVHTGEKPVKCSHCEKSFYDDTALSKHMKTARHLQRVNTHEGKVVEIEKPFLCSRCGARFYRRQSLFRHVVLVHSASESFKCPHCEYNTKCKTNLKRHIELHTGTKRFICEICGSSFRAFATLKEHHVYVHSENREFICDICSKGFKNNSNLQRHMRIHSENRPYKCHCNRDYKRMSHLKRHMATAHNMILKRNQIPIIKESTNLDIYLNNDNVTALVDSLETLPDQSSCDDFSASTVSNSSAACTELNDTGMNGTTCEEQLSVSSEGDINCTDVPLNIMQTLDKSEAHIISDDARNTLITCVSVANIQAVKTPPVCLLPDLQASSVSSDDPNLNLSPNNYCNFNLPSSPLSSIPIESVTSTLQHSIISQDVLSCSSSTDGLIRPHSLPNLNFQTHVSSIDSFAHFSLHNSDSQTSIQIPSFLLTGDISSPSHVTDLNLEQNSSPKQLFGDSDDILSLPPYASSSELGESNCSSEHFFNPVRDMELWDTDDNSSQLKISSDDLVATSTCANISFSSSLTCNANNLLPHNLFSNDSLMVCSLDTAALNSEFDALANLC